MSLQERLQADLRSLQALAVLNPGRVQLSAHAPDLRRFSVRIYADAPVALPAGGFGVGSEHTLLVEIPDNYLKKDGAGRYIKSRIRRQGARIFHPNVYAEGAFCYDALFHPAKSLAEQVVTAFELMQCRLINHRSPASIDVNDYFLAHPGFVRSHLRPARLLLPRGEMAVIARPVPRVA